MAEFKVKIPDMMCAHCEKRIREAIINAGGSVKSLNLTIKEVVMEIECDSNKVLAILDDAGYDAEIL